MSLTKDDIELYLRELNTELASENTKGEICLYGGAVMCLAFDARPATKDVDAIFKPATIIRGAAARIAMRHNLREDWLNDAVKGFVVEHRQNLYAQFSHLTVYLPDAHYLLAMKTLAARVDTTDKDDILLLIDKLNLKAPDEVFAVVEAYYPHDRIKPATQFFIEEIFDTR